MGVVPLSERCGAKGPTHRPSGMARFAHALDPSAREEVDRRIDAVKGAHVNKRGLPSCGGAFLSGISGTGRLASGAEKQG